MNTFVGVGHGVEFRIFFVNKYQASAKLKRKQPSDFAKSLSYNAYTPARLNLFPGVLCIFASSLTLLFLTRHAVNISRGTFSFFSVLCKYIRTCQCLARFEEDRSLATAALNLLINFLFSQNAQLLHWQMNLQRISICFPWRVG